MYSCNLRATPRVRTRKWKNITLHSSRLLSCLASETVDPSEWVRWCGLDIHTKRVTETKQTQQNGNAIRRSKLYLPPDFSELFFHFPGSSAFVHAVSPHNEQCNAGKQTLFIQNKERLNISLSCGYNKFWSTITVRMMGKEERKPKNYINWKKYKLFSLRTVYCTVYSTATPSLPSLQPLYEASSDQSYWQHSLSLVDR